MVSFTALRQHPRFGRFFEVVHPFFWPVIWWTLNAVFRAYDASNRAGLAGVSASSGRRDRPRRTIQR
jgi:hypothetical protein